MAQLKAQYGPYNDELHAGGLPSGTAIDMLNTVIDSNTIIGGRLGFDVFDDDIDAGPVSFGNILNMHVATFADGDVYLVTKRSDGKLYHRKLYPSDAGAWTLIANKWPSGLHNTSDRGWFYMAADRLYYFDRVGGTKWNPDAGVFKAGIENTQAPLITAISGGGKDGWYHVTTTNVNTKTGEESTFSGIQSGGAAESRITSSEGTIRITNWHAGDGTGVSDKTSDQDFEFNSHNVYSTLGNTERIGLGSGVTQFSYEFYFEDWAPAPSGAGTFDGLWRMDALIVRRPMLPNTGGQPPGAEFGCYNGSQAVYFQVYPKAKWSILDLTFSTLAEGWMMYSNPGFPASVPQTMIQDSAATLDRQKITPVGGAHEIQSGMDGLVTGCGFVGGTFLAFTNSSTHSFSSDGSGDMRPVVADPVRGAIGYNPVVSTGSSVHALGKDAWLRIADGIRDISHEQFTPTLEAIPDAGLAATTGGFYSHRGEVWFAVAKAGGTSGKAQRILIWSERKGELVAKFDPANLSTAGIKAMVELSHPTQTPVMLIALDTGVILQWPGSAYVDEVVGSSSLGYATNWKGLFGQEQRANDRYVKRTAASMVMVPATGMTIGASGIQNAAQASGETLIEHTILPATNAPAETRLENVGAVYFDAKANGKMFVIELSSTISQGADWKIGDLLFEIDADNRS